MLVNLQIENIAIIESASVDFVNGLNVLSGETGAGKSIIIDAINAVLGEKTSRELIRTGANAAFVRALFSGITDNVLQFLRNEDLPIEEDGSLLIQRKLYKDGRNLCHINGTTVTVSVLRRLGLMLINIHGQRDSQELLNPDDHYLFVDRFGGLEEYFKNYKEAFDAWIHCEQKLKKLISDNSEKDRVADLLQYQIRELETADIKIGEREQLNEKKKLIRSLDKLNKALNGAFSSLYTAVDATSAASRFIVDASKVSPSVGALDASIQEALTVLIDCRDETESVISQLEGCGDDIESIEERLDLLYRLSKKYGNTEEEILHYLATCKEQLDALENSQATIDKIEHECTEKLRIMNEAAVILSEKRAYVAEKLRLRIEDELHFLDMPSAVFVVNIVPVEPSEVGFENIEFYISANPGEEPKPLSKVASGGELSRVMLAIKNALADKDSIGTLIFDEIDTGVSGRAADKISRKLKQAASIRQVLCITHLSQIAARADAHYLVEKKVKDDKTFTCVNLLSFSGRVDELARMNGGFTLTQVHRESARMLLEESGIFDE